MSKKRSKDGEEEERIEMMRLTKVAKSWEFTCSFCFKKFPSAQAMGGHQNAHRRERLEEKRLFVKDPIAYRKRAFLRAIKGDDMVNNVDRIININAAAAAAAAVEERRSSSSFYQSCWSCKESFSEEEGEKACIATEFDGINNLDLTLKL